MDVFDLRNRMVGDYADYVRSFITIRDGRIRAAVDDELRKGLLWPEPRIGLNPSFESGGLVDELVEQQVLHSECASIFRVKEEDGSSQPLRLHRHQVDAIEAARQGGNYVLTTGTGSGKSLSYIVPVVDAVLREGPGQGIKAIVVYPMNALANSQAGELEKFLQLGYPPGQPPVTFRRYTGQETDEARRAIIDQPPDILLTNYVMLELILTRVNERDLVRAAQGLRFLVFDELHTYRGRQGADVALLARRVRQRCGGDRLQMVGTSATMVTGGTLDEQRTEVARVASLLFGAEVEPQHVIGETLRRATMGEPTPAELAERLRTGRTYDLDDADAFVRDPLSAWIETTFGVVNEAETGRLVRVAPQPVDGAGAAAEQLAALSGADRAECAAAIREQLMAGYHVKVPGSGFPVFPFRLHQFISRGDTVHATLEAAPEREITLDGQTYVKGDRSRSYFPLVFCRECGHEYYSVYAHTDGGEPARFDARSSLDRQPAEDARAGYLFIDLDEPWPDDADAVLRRVPESWLERTGDVDKLKRDFRKWLPQRTFVAGDGTAQPGGVLAHFVPAPFRFCLHCGVAYSARQRNDFSKLGTLGTEGRSTATTLLSLSAIRQLRQAGDLPPRARKLLAFSDNRQDASLQAGHFNDFIETGLLRSALYRAAEKQGDAGLTHDVLTQRVFEALDLDFDLYALDPDVKYGRDRTEKALREVLGYRLYLDQRRGWRIASPNLEQTGLLSIQYESLGELCRDEGEWLGKHLALARCRPEDRELLGRTLLDFMRRELAIHVDYLDNGRQESIRLQSNQQLRSPWALDENEQFEHASIVFPRSAKPGDYGGLTFVSGRSGFGQFLRNTLKARNIVDHLTLDETQTVIVDLLEALRRASLVVMVKEPESATDVAGYQVNAASMWWVAGDGSEVAPDPIRAPRASDAKKLPNAFFLDFYRGIASDGRGLVAREHTAQVRADVREDREADFREARLPILFCSPTMELGVDISQLNVVGLRNMPPTPANYAQRSGRAGRSGQPALVFTYCSTGSPHDQYYFRRPERMVAGQVAPPRLDLTNQDLVEAHVYAVWLAEAGLSLGASLTDLLDVTGDEPTLDLLPDVSADLRREEPRRRAADAVRLMLGDVLPLMETADWWSDGWLERVLQAVPQRFERASDRWRSLYRSALHQAQRQSKIINDASKSADDRKQAKRLRVEAEKQMELLRSETDRQSQSDFYSYRYFASEGFLPGYSFPRLPLSAFLPGRRQRVGHDEFLSRPRFLAINEFGPRNFVYHEGSRYVINRVILPVGRGGVDNDAATITDSAKLCTHCGYLHPVDDGAGADVCEHCARELPAARTSLFRMQNVAAKRRDRISSDEEERQRQGFDVRTAVRFSVGERGPMEQRAFVELGDTQLARLTYGHAATIWRINLGWRRRKPAAPEGFVLDTQYGYWARREGDAAEGDDGDNDPMSRATARVIPYVEDTRNCLIVELDRGGSQAELVSLQAALRTAIQIRFQLEESELAAEPLPDRDHPRALLFFEAAEGGAGVLRRLVDDPKAMADVARTALDLCHFDVDGTEKPLPDGAEPCEAACYDCLQSYGNQPDHRTLDRQLIRPLLVELSGAATAVSSGPLPREELLKQLVALVDSTLEREWLLHLDQRGLRLPSRGQVRVPDHPAQPDFAYETPESVTFVYIDGDHHRYPHRAERDRAIRSALEDAGYGVVAFADPSGWDAILDARPDVFGTPVS